MCRSQPALGYDFENNCYFFGDGETYVEVYGPELSERLTRDFYMMVFELSEDFSILRTLQDLFQIKYWQTICDDAWQEIIEDLLPNIGNREFYLFLLKFLMIPPGDVVLIEEDLFKDVSDKRMIEILNRRLSKYNLKLQRFQRSLAFRLIDKNKVDSKWRLKELTLDKLMKFFQSGTEIAKEMKMFIEAPNGDWILGGPHMARIKWIIYKIEGVSFGIQVVREGNLRGKNYYRLILLPEET